jgi:uncharacterized protein YbaP (TraB family)
MRRWLSFLFALCFVAHAYAAETFKQGILWKIEHDGVAPSYLFGTIHVSDARVAALPKAVKQAFDSAKSFTTEMVVDSAAESYFVHAMTLKPGNDLRDVLGDELYAKAVAAMQDRGVPPDMTRRLKPWGVLITLIVPEPTGEPILDRRLQELAAERKKPVRQLESVQEQVAVFDEMPLNVQIAMLESAIDHHDELPRLIERTIEDYLARDLDSLWKLNELYGDDAREHYDYFVERVLFTRNVRMADRVKKQLKEGGAFIAVGALHLYGEKGVPALLKKAGYHVSRVY